jgi:hypothetical protein
MNERWKVIKKGWEGDKEDASSYRMTLRKREHSGA